MLYRAFMFGFGLVAGMLAVGALLVAVCGGFLYLTAGGSQPLPDDGVRAMVTADGTLTQAPRELLVCGDDECHLPAGYVLKRVPGGFVTVPAWQTR